MFQYLLAYKLILRYIAIYNMKKRTLLSLFLTIAFIIITHKFWLVVKSKTSVHLEFEILVIIVILSFLLFYKLTDYIADFKTKKEKSRVDIVFLTIFFVFLFIPMSHINQENISKQENRTLAKWQQLIKENNEINYNFGKDIEKWFNDRFFCRKFFIDTFNAMHIIFNKSSNKGFVDRSGFLYMDWEFKEINPYEEKSGIKAIERFAIECRDSNTKLYLLLIPQRSNIYTPKRKLRKIPNTDKLMKFAHEVNQEGLYKIVFPYYELQNGAKKDYMYFKTEHHLTDDGAFVVYNALMNEVKKDFPELNISKSSDFDLFYDKKIRGDYSRRFDWGTTCGRIGMPKKMCKSYHKDTYRYYKYKDKFDNIETKDINKNLWSKEFEYKKGINKKILMLGTSHNENLTEFIPYTFSKTLRLRILEQKNCLKIKKYFNNEIEKYKPDIVLLCICYSEFPQLKDLYLKE